jgi:hypothetical protein
MICGIGKQMGGEDVGAAAEGQGRMGGGIFEVVRFRLGKHLE